MNIPSINECLSLMDSYGMLDNIREHSFIVARVAETIVSGNRDDFPFPVEAHFREKWRALRAGYYSYGTLALQLVQRR